MNTAIFDSMAANGIINFDADAYIKGTPPRYVGKPSYSNLMPFDQPLTGYGYGYPMGAATVPRIESQPFHDKFENAGTHGSAHSGHDPFQNNNNAGLKKTLAYGVVIGGIAMAAYKIRSIAKGRKSKKAAAAASNALTPASTSASAGTATKVKGSSKLKQFLKSSAGKKLGIGGLIFLGLYGLYTFIKRPKKMSSHN